ncbi:MAG: hypothetical protein JWM09_684 [Francisellaceae bacterium]|nr:hypothetical protein [Francisellaceae bacterium]
MKPNKYLACIQISMRQQLAKRTQLLGRIFLYSMIVYLFSQVFQSVQAPPQRIWYLAVTEWIILSAPPIAFQISEDINSGQIVYFLLKPIHYLILRFCENLGSILIRFVLLGIICVGLSFSLTRFIPNSLSTWIIGIILVFISILLASLVGILIGLFSFWVKDIKTLIYLNLTMTFCLGGLIVPLSFYSKALYILCYLTPYPWILGGPAEYLSGTVQNCSSLFLGSSLWVLALLILIKILYKKCLLSFTAEGG